MTQSAVMDKVVDELEHARGHATLLHTNLSAEQEAKLRAAFADEPPAGE
jgi:uncharacterized membrane protein